MQISRECWSVELERGRWEEGRGKRWKWGMRGEGEGEGVGGGCSCSLTAVMPRRRSFLLASPRTLLLPLVVARRLGLLLLLLTWQGRRVKRCML